MMVILLLVGLCFPMSARTPVNRIRARVNDTLILQSDVLQKQISKNGEYATLDELIEQELLYQRAQERNLLPSDADIDTQVISLKRDNNLVGRSDADCDLFLRKEAGITFEQYRHQLRKALAVERVKAHDLGQRTIVTPEEIKSYCESHPEYTQALYRFKLATVPLEMVSVGQEFTGTYDQLSWDTFGWLKQHEIARHLHAVMSLRPGEYSKPIKHNGEYLMVGLIDKAPAEIIPLEKRYALIERTLQIKKQDRVAHDFAKELRENAVVTKL